MNAPDVMTAALVVLVIFDWLAVLILHRAYQRAAAGGSRVRSLVDRRRTAILISVASTVATVIGLNRYFRVLNVDIVLVLLALAVILPSLANFAFVLDIWRGRFD
jgi:hypothetical protein